KRATSTATGSFTGMAALVGSAAERGAVASVVSRLSAQRIETLDVGIELIKAPHLRLCGRASIPRDTCRYRMRPGTSPCWPDCSRRLTVPGTPCAPRPTPRARDRHGSAVPSYRPGAYRYPLHRM